VNLFRRQHVPSLDVVVCAAVTLELLPRPEGLVVDDPVGTQLVHSRHSLHRNRANCSI